MLSRKGQNIAEYSILIAIVIAAAVAMQVYVKRGIQGRVADAVDHADDADLGDAGTISFTTKQYEPYYVDNDLDKTANKEVTETVDTRGETTRDIATESESKTGTEKTTTASEYDR